MKAVSHRRLRLACSFVFALLIASGWNQLGFAQTADLDQCRNGSATSPSNCVDNGNTGWVNGNAGASSAHYLESLSIPYRVVMKDLPLNTPITLTLEYDNKHSGKHAIDFLTHYDRLEPHGQFGHTAETVSPTSGVTGLSATVGTFPIPAPSSPNTGLCASPVAGQPTTAFNSILPATKREMTLFGGTITNIQYVSQGCLTDTSAETSISVTFTVDSATAVLAFGGHIASASNWGEGNSAGAISGSPYHVRLVDWTIPGGLGNQDRSLSAGAVFDPCAGVLCGDGACTTNACVNGVCQIQSYKDNTTVCRDSAGVCDVAEYCTGSSATCPADLKSTGECRAAAGVCDVPEMCNGTSNSCPADGFASNTIECRPSAGICDVAEMCTGKSVACPSDQFAGSNTVCRTGSGDSCDPEERCTGSSAACPANVIASNSTLCRAGSGDSCDPPEYCTGIAGQACPANQYASAATMCRAGSGDSCDPPEYCPGTPGGSCPVNVVASANTVCRPGSGDYCDPDEKCTGIAGRACPADYYERTTTMCRPTIGTCDVPEYCPGTPGGWCPGDQIADNRTLCRAASGLCDVAEYCSGYDKTCPTDYIVPPGATCRPSAGSCDVPEVCDGSSKQCPTDVFVTAGYLCRESAGLCDPEELCTGNSPLCPVNVVFDPTRDPTCEAEFCRTAGFWSTHAGSEKKNGKSQNITLAVIDLADRFRNLPAKDLINLYGQYGKLEICGENIVNTQLNDAASALESMCVSPQGDQRLQLVRQLTAASLNCVLSGGNPECIGVDGPSNITIEDIFAACNTACAAGATTVTDGTNTISCIAAVDCWNNGGVFHEATGFCQTGTCSLDGVTACNSKSGCPLYYGQTQSCLALAGTCHDQPLVKDGFFDFDPPGPAGSSDACNQAIGNKCTVIAPGEVYCKVDSAP